MLIECQRMWYQWLTSGCKKTKSNTHAGRYECGIHPIPLTSTMTGDGSIASMMISGMVYGK